MGKGRGSRYTDEFRRQTVDLIIKDGYSVSAAARQVGATYETVRKWRDKIIADSETQHEGLDIKQIVEENRRLRKALKQAEMEREILKKATAYLARDTQ